MGSALARGRDKLEPGNLFAKLLIESMPAAPSPAAKTASNTSHQRAGLPKPCQTKPAHVPLWISLGSHLRPNARAGALRSPPPSCAARG